MLLKPESILGKLAAAKILKNSVCVCVCVCVRERVCVCV